MRIRDLVIHKWGVVVLAVASWLAGGLSGKAAVLDWDITTWTAGALTQTFYATNTANAGGKFYADDAYAGVGSITITLSGSTSGLISGYPAIENVASSGQDGLRIMMNQPNNTAAIVTTITFGGYDSGVNNVNTILNDVDRTSPGAGFIDVITNLQGRFGTNAPTAAHLTRSQDNRLNNNDTLSAYGYGTGSVTADSSRGNLGISYGTNTVSQVTFTYGNLPGTDNNPVQQFTYLADINFTPVPKIPEVGTTLAVAFLCGIPLISRLIRRK